MRVSSRGAAKEASDAVSLLGNRPGESDVHDADWPGESVAVEMGSLLDTPWARLNKDVLMLVAAYLSEADRARMRRVCRAWAWHVRVSHEDAQRIARGCARVRADRRAKLRRIWLCLRVPVFVAVLFIACAWASLGATLVVVATVPDSLSYVDVACFLDAPSAIYAFPVQQKCCSGCSAVTRYRAVISINNGTAAEDNSWGHRDGCEYDTFAKAVVAATDFMTSCGASCPCVRRSPSSIDVSMAAVQTAGAAAVSLVDTRALSLGMAKQDFMNLFIVGCVAFFCALLTAVLAFVCFYQCPRK
jgi:hypothetical protein